MPHAEATLPFQLDTPAFKKAWEEYVDYRREKKIAKLLSRSVQKQWDRLADFGPEVAVAAIDETIRNGWQGLFPDKVHLAPSPAHTAGSHGPGKPGGFASLGALQLQLKAINEKAQAIYNPSGQAWPPPLTGEKLERYNELIRQRSAIERQICNFTQ
jgi:hypothetical protein